MGYDLQCGLVDRANALRTRFAPDAPIHFHCADALEADDALLASATLVYLDNDGWDTLVSKRLYARLSKRLAAGAVVIGWKHPTRDLKVKRRRQGWSEVSESFAPYATWSPECWAHGTCCLGLRCHDGNGWREAPAEEEMAVGANGMPVMNEEQEGLDLWRTACEGRTCRRIPLGASVFAVQRL